MAEVPFDYETAYKALIIANINNEQARRDLNTLGKMTLFDYKCKLVKPTPPAAGLAHLVNEEEIKIEFTPTKLMPNYIQKKHYFTIEPFCNAYTDEFTEYYDDNNSLCIYVDCTSKYAFVIMSKDIHSSRVQQYNFTMRRKRAIELVEYIGKWWLQFNDDN